MKHIQVHDLTIAYDNFVLLKDISFSVKKGDIFFIMGGSGCGKSSLLRVLTGLTPIHQGTIEISLEKITPEKPTFSPELLKRFGVLYQSGALFSSMTLSENIALPLEKYTDYSPSMAPSQRSFIAK